jgi:hypothetical protein
MRHHADQADAVAHQRHGGVHHVDGRLKAPLWNSTATSGWRTQQRHRARRRQQHDEAKAPVEQAE